MIDFEFNGGRRGALIVGINDYKNLSADYQLKGAENDAREIHGILSENGGFIDPTLIVNSDASRNNIIDKLYDILFKDAYDTVFFYFAGHGLVDSFGTTFIAPSDFDPVKPYLCGIPMNHLAFIISRFHKLSTEKSKKVICTFVDCCHSAKLMDSSEERSLDETESRFGQQASQHLEAEGQVGITSMDRDERSREQEFEGHFTKKEKHWHGVFSYNLLQGLEGSNITGKIITLDSIIKYMNDQMVASPQRVYSLVRGQGNITELDLVVSPVGIDDYIGDLASKCTLTDKSSMLSLRDTGTYIIRLQKFKNKCQRYQDKMNQCRHEITEQLNMFRGSTFNFVNRFFTENQDNRDRLKQIHSDLFKTLEDIPPANLSSFDRFMDTVGFRRCLLNALDRIVTNPNNTNLDTFIESCRDCVNKYYKTDSATNTAGGTKRIDTNMATKGGS